MGHTLKKHNPRSLIDLIRIAGLTLVTGVIYIFLKVQGKLRL